MTTMTMRMFFTKPLSTLLLLFGWNFYYRSTIDHDKRKPYRRWKWGFTRASVDLYDGRYDGGPVKTGKQKLVSLSSESYWFNRACRHLTLLWRVNDSRRSLGIHFGLPFICMHYMTVSWDKECWFAKLLRGKYANSLEYGLDINTTALSWNWAQDTMAWASDGSTGYHFYLPMDRWVERPDRINVFTKVMEDVPFTQPGYNGRPATDHVMTITYTCNRHKFRRPWNWHKNKVVHSVDMDIKKPPAFSGKGENSWDCGDDGIYGCGANIPTNDIDARLASEIPVYARQYAINNYIERVQKERAHHG